MTLDELNEASREVFVAALGGIFEHSPWVAEAVADERPFESVGALHEAMAEAVATAGRDRQLALIRAHPDLAGKAARAGTLTEESTREQKGAGLDRLSDAEFEEFHRLNDAYKARFGFPFVLAVRGFDGRTHDAHSILASFRARLDNSVEAEIDEAVRQIARIARLRLDDLIS
ncbi:2-oxo-4-hydroxy-4-carboxy-5-ureidoimidazoline decarboxylase [Phyllobacterium salinisoli]|uniref:2-oxo-4-hydroxy-4-carboxy-5-ureidoimidazoline decarboxylase n=1 Tax=Phyllobacterium salinisoli TaxID=1899321 RepID=A0A368K4D6_9HYPH|nr:2-oxo-4-hydroxy-4-carboxy-5-ureidoimidazoline decarboxylase [Phyllobacterium salinisoli]RCS23343.1 2-oxo-4-hydroxy-4-carboxy-5-ureidoimidazoline decarboxylase [Phyllobacterium salinisoli]